MFIYIYINPKVFQKHLLRSVSEITRKNLLIRSIGIALNCQNIYGN